MQLMKNWANMLCGIGFMKPEQTDHFMQGFHRVFSRGVFSRDDAALMLGVARQALWAADKAKNANPVKEGDNG
jgi:tRNA C32,U32 (ribose-2'-O)-methylase TrmJ